jgi:hypothetical protein
MVKWVAESEVKQKELEEELKGEGHGHEEEHPDAPKSRYERERGGEDRR